MTAPKRKYVRLTPSVWAEICALWEIGDVTLPDLAERYSVATRTLQAHFAKLKVEKGSKAAALAISVKTEVYATGLADKDLTVQRARDTREAAYKQASVVEGLIMGVLEAMQKDPAKTLGLSSTLKALALAAGSFERTHGLKLRALGLDKDLPIYDEMPVLTFRDLTKDEIRAMQQADQDDDEGESFVSESTMLAVQSADDEPEPDEADDDIVIEGDERRVLADKTVLKEGDGCRLVTRP